MLTKQVVKCQRNFIMSWTTPRFYLMFCFNASILVGNDLQLSKSRSEGLNRLNPLKSQKTTLGQKVGFGLRGHNSTPLGGCRYMYVIWRNISLKDMWYVCVCFCTVFGHTTTCSHRPTTANVLPWQFGEISLIVLNTVHVQETTQQIQRFLGKHNNFSWGFWWLFPSFITTYTRHFLSPSNISGPTNWLNLY